MTAKHFSLKHFSLKHLLSALGFSVALTLAGCTGVPENVTPVQGFEVNRYLGQWYEIARLDHAFERGLTQVTANYSVREDGGIKVINRGYSAEERDWQQAEGKAYVVGAEDVGHLKVSFFGPFYGAYVVFDLDKANYQYAMVSGPSKSYLWLLARTPTVAEPLKQAFLHKAAELGFAVDEIIFVEQ